MTKINVLDKNTIDKIAAGEVIDRPSSIVKEMLENAIDAKSTAVTVEIKDGGISLIRITDNGVGIEKEDIKKAFLRHATSKIKTVEDLISTSSLGFRGEALSSIAAVTQLECITKTSSDLTGIRYVIEGGEEKVLEEVGAPSGTTFVVRNLFYNTPARKKFLKTAQTEASYIGAIVEKIALSHPEVSIRFINNNQTKLHTSGNGKIKDIIYSIFGRDVTNNLLEIDDKAEQMQLTGYIGKPIVSRGNRNNMIYFINGRYIKSKIVNNAIEEAYKPFMMQHNYPFTALYFNIDSSLIDVNVHPSKMELRFERQMDVYNLIYSAVSAALKRRELIPEALIDEVKVLKKNAVKPDSVRKAEPFEIKRMEQEKKPEMVAQTPIVKEEPPVYKVDNKNELKNLSELKQEVRIEQKNVTEAKMEVKSKTPVKTEPEINLTPEPEINLTKEPEIKQLDLFDNRFLSEKQRSKHKMIGQLFDTYWLIEYENNLYIVDQHAAHEKVLFEKTMKSLKDKKIDSQMLNPPIILTLSMEEEMLLNKFMDNFIKLGYEIEPFGGREYAVRGVPANLFSISQKDLLMNIIGSLNENSSSLKSELITEKIASMSCKAAVKGNNKLSVSEANELIEQLLDLDNPYNCPHGRPTIISMSKYEIEKKFKRVL